MRLPYVEYQIPPSATIPSGVIRRPELLVRVSSGGQGAYLLALLDTGADETVLPRSLGELLGVEVDERSRSRACGIAGQEVSVSPGTVEFEITGDGKTYRWRAVVGFVDFDDPRHETAVLGHAGCLDYFTVTFDGEQHAFEIVPNGSLPGV